MLHSMVTIIETPFTTTPTHIIVGMRSKPQTLKGTDLTSMHTKMPKEVDKIFVGQPSNLGRGTSRPPRPPRTFKTFKIIWITNGESKQITITTK